MTPVGSVIGKPAIKGNEGLSGTRMTSFTEMDRNQACMMSPLCTVTLRPGKKLSSLRTEQYVHHPSFDQPSLNCQSVRYEERVDSTLHSDKTVAVMLNKLLNFIPVFIFFSKINSLQALLEMFDIFETLQNNTFFYLKE